MTPFSFEPIGYVQSCYPERFGTPRQPGLTSQSWAVLRLRAELNLAGGLEGLAGFSHVWLIFVFHKNTNKRVHTKVHPPRLEGDKIGVFASRSPHRPNPIGLSVVKLEKIQTNSIYLSGIDLIDGTPVLDIKPYIPQADCLIQATGGWTDRQPSNRRLEVVFSQECLIQIQELEQSTHTEYPRDLKALIRETLELDPRPGFYKGTASNENPYTDVYGVGIENLNVVFRMKGQVAMVLRLENWQDWQSQKFCP